MTVPYSLDWGAQRQEARLPLSWDCPDWPVDVEDAPGWLVERAEAGMLGAYRMGSVLPVLLTEDDGPLLEVMAAALRRSPRIGRPRSYSEKARASRARAARRVVPAWWSVLEGAGSDSVRACFAPVRPPVFELAWRDRTGALRSLSDGRLVMPAPVPEREPFPRITAEELAWTRAV